MASTIRSITNMTFGTKEKGKQKEQPIREPRYCSTGRLDFEKYDLHEYKSCFALVLDDIFTASELRSFLAAAEASSPWEVAAVNAGTAAYVDKSYRNSQRIIFDSEEISAQIFERIRRHLHEVEEMAWENWTREGRATKKLRMVKMNERLRFLRYEKGGFFRRHIDGPYITPDGLQRTFLTMQLYLPSSANDDDPTDFQKSLIPAKGGSTRFVQPSLSKHDAWVDVEARPGRVLIFQHDKLMHTGEEVIEGIKCTVRSDILFEDIAGGRIG